MTESIQTMGVTIADGHAGPRRRMQGLLQQNASKLFLAGLVSMAAGAGVGLVSPPVALVAGAAFGFTVAHPYKRESAALAKLLLQASVVALGFGVDLHEVLRVGRSGFAYTAVSIACAMALGLVLGRVLKVEGKASFLIASGTAICGGSAIAALAPILNAGEEEISVSMGTVFLLNSLALLLFPAVGFALRMTQSQFGLWSALAIHDTSSVVGAAAKYGDVALAIGTTVKLARALWIVPLSLATAFVMRRRKGGSGAKIALPWFIGLFCLASVARTYATGFAPLYGMLNHLGKAGLTATLFLIGTSLSRQTLRETGPRPLLQGVLLWIVVGTATLVAIRGGWIAI